MNDPHADEPLDPESPPAPASYVSFLERWNPPPGSPSAPGTTPPEPAPVERKARTASSRRKARRTRPSAAGDALAPFLAPRRRTATEPIKVRLAAEQLYWLRLTAARAGRKVNEATIVAAGLRVIEWLDLDWRCIDSRAALAAALAEALGTAAAPASGLAAADREWESMQRQLAAGRHGSERPGAAAPGAAAAPSPTANPAPAADEGRS